MVRQGGRRVLRVERVTGGGTTAVLAVRGHLVLSEANLLRAALEEALAETPAGVVVDFTECSLVDSSGLGALVAGLKQAHQAGVPLRIAGVSEQLRLTLERTKLSRVLLEVPFPGADSLAT